VASSSNDLQSLLNRAAQEERLARKRAIVYSLIPVVAAAILIGFTGWRVRRAQNDLAKVNLAINDRAAELLRVQGELAENEAKLSNAQLALRAVNSQRLGKRATVEYFPRSAEGQRVVRALGELDFQIVSGEPNPLFRNIPTNAIWFGEPVPLDDVKLVAYALIRGGIQIKGIKRLKQCSPSRTKLVILVGGSPRVASRKALTLDEVRQARDFETDTGSCP